MPSSFFLKYTAPTEIYPLSLHAALPICLHFKSSFVWPLKITCPPFLPAPRPKSDRKSTRLNSSHSSISYALFFFFKVYGAHRDLPSFPTRRSSDLLTFQKFLRLAVKNNLPAVSACAEA